MGTFGPAPGATGPDAGRKEGATNLLRCAAALSVLHAAALALAYAGQPLVDSFGFRQSQTALTSAWMVREGFQFDYLTPVGGPPWRLPFEAPFYQALAAGLSVTLGAPLDPIGRILSFMLLCACVIPIRAMLVRWGAPERVFWILLTLLFTSPIYLYWGRAFLVETAALLLSLGCIPLFLDLRDRGPTPVRLLAFIVLATGALLQKSTTALPVILVLMLNLAVLEWRRKGVTAARIATWSAAFGVPLLALAAWVRHADAVKSCSILGTHLTSSALSAWNWGSLSQRLDPAAWGMAIWERTIVSGAGGGVGLSILLLGLALPAPAHPRGPIALLAGLGFLAPAMFLNLHVVHAYYPSANVAFLLIACAWALGGPIHDAPRGRVLSPLMLAALIAMNLRTFHAENLEDLVRPHDVSTSAPLHAAAAIRESTPPDSAFVMVGQDWSSEIPYYAQRRALAIPAWLPDRQRILDDPARAVHPIPLGAILIAGSDEECISLRSRYSLHPAFRGVDLAHPATGWTLFLRR